MNNTGIVVGVPRVVSVSVLQAAGVPTKRT